MTASDQKPALDPHYVQAVQVLEAAGCTPAEPLKVGLQAARLQQDRYFAYLNEDAPAVHQAQDVMASGPAGPLRMRVIQPSKSPGRHVIVFLRGAGWWAGDLRSHERTARVIATQTQSTCVVLDYHRSPEAQFPVQRDEVLACIDWIRRDDLQWGFKDQKLILWGESAGATLAALAANQLRDRDQPQVDAMVLFYGNFDGPGPGTRAQSLWVWQQLLGDRFEHPPAQSIPTRCDVKGWPATWLAVGDADPLFKDTALLAGLLQQAGVRHQLRVYRGLPHGFMTLGRVFEQATLAVDDAWRDVRGWTP